VKRYKPKLRNPRRSEAIKSSSFSKSNLVTFAIIFAAIGGYLIYSSFAAGLSSSIEPENGTITSPASMVTDASASGGKAVKFGGSVPAACNNGGAFLWSNLETCGWPGPANTGYPVGQTFTNTSTRTISANNTVINGERITGNLTITGQNVTIKNSLILYSGSGGGGSGAIKILAGGSATIDHVEINGQTAVHTCIWHEGASLTVKAVNCHNVEDGIFSWESDNGVDNGNGDNFTIEDSYIHDLGGNESNGHLDGYQTEGAKNGVIRHNTFGISADASGAISIWDSLKSSNNILVENNLISGGGFSIYAEDYSPSEATNSSPNNPVGGYTVTNIVYTNNKFSTIHSSCVGSFGVWFFRSAWTYQGGPTGNWGANGNTRTGNKILETGFNLDNGNPSGCT
jgi:hypothetical protein